jgi:hypothetical protein
MRIGDHGRQRPGIGVGGLPQLLRQSVIRIVSPNVMAVA